MFSGLQPNSRLLFAWAISLLPMACSDGCGRSSEPPDSIPGTASGGSSPAAGSPIEPLETLGSSSNGVNGEGSAGALDAGVPAEWTGPFFTVTSSSAGIYLQPSLDRALKIGYARSGGRLAVLPEKVSGEACRVGWYQLAKGGYICGSAGTTNVEDPLARLAVQAPDMSAILPYPYARNAHNGTPLYSSVPSQDQMAAYEPYLEAARTSAGASGAAPLVADAGSRPWWQREEAQISEVRLAQLANESDGVLARRMVKGFYIAIDKEFEWSSRTWYKTTKGMVAPKDRFVPVEGADFKGIELTEDQGLPVAWVYGFRQNRPRYQLSDAGKVKQVGVFDRLTPIYLSGDGIEVDRQYYVQSRDSFLVRADHVRIARAPLIPASVTADERWIHVDLRSQTLVALIGSRPVYATLISSGKESEDATKDFRSPTGEWHIREKHVTTTMDGDGTAAGDLPYSIEDVPYAMYFEGSYALHGAFWHRNYGVRMSHGCINLAPLDAKHLFLFTGPVVREGWHGAWSGNGQAGSRIVIDGPARGSPAGP